MIQMFLQSACKLPWTTVAAIIGTRVSGHLHKPIRCSANQEDTHYWDVQALDEEFTRQDIMYLLRAESADPDTVQIELSLEDTSIRALGMELSRMLLRHGLQADWETEFITADALWLLGLRSCNTPSDTVQAGRICLPGQAVLLSELKSQADLMEYLRHRSSHFEALLDFCDEYMDRYGNCLFWNYPISDGKHLGTYLVLVREGILSLPYDEDDVSSDRFNLEDAVMFRTADEMECFIDDWQYFNADLTQAMYAMKAFLQQQEVKQHDNSTVEN